MKKYLPFLTGCLLIAGAMLCINFRTIKMVWFMSSRFMVPDSPLSMDQTAAFDLNKLKLSPEDRAFVEGYLRHRDFAWYQSMSEKYPDDKVFLTAYILELLREPEKNRAELLPLLEKLKQLDPDNALPYYGQAKILFNLALETKFVTKKQRQDIEYHIRDRDLLKKATASFYQGLQKPYCSSYGMQIPNRIIRLLHLKDDPFGSIQKTWIGWGGNGSWYLLGLSSMIRHLLFYAETLHREGKTAESRAILHSGPKLLCQLMRQDQGTLLEVLVYYSLSNRYYLKSAKELKDREAIGLYQKPYDFFEDWKKKKLDKSNIEERHGGIWSMWFIPGTAMRPFSVSELTPERMINYLVVDELALTGFCVCVLLLLCLHAAIAHCKRGESVRFDPKSWFRIIGYGMLLPLAVFLLYTHVDFLSGREFSFRMNWIRLFIGIGFLLFLWIPLSAIVRKETKGKPFAAYARSMLFPLALFLFLTGAVLRPLFDWEISHYWRRDTLFRNSKSVSVPEDQAHDLLTAKLKMFMQEKDKGGK